MILFQTYFIQNQTELHKFVSLSQSLDATTCNTTSQTSKELRLKLFLCLQGMNLDFMYIFVLKTFLEKSLVLKDSLYQTLMRESFHVHKVSCVTIEWSGVVLLVEVKAMYVHSHTSRGHQLILVVVFGVSWDTKQFQYI